MAYLVHTHLSPRLPVRKALTSFFGIGPFRAHMICDQLGFRTTKRVEEMSAAHIAVLTRILTHTYFTESELRRAIAEDVKRLVSIASYRGFRHVQRLPLRGQRTRTNSRSARRTGVRAKGVDL
jgi:small subunit ribosomal protein S13